MANLHVWASGSNDPDYETWTKAATTFATAVSACSAGDTIYVDDGHTQSTGADQIYAFPSDSDNPVRVLCVDKAGAVGDVGGTLSDMATGGGNISTGAGTGYELTITGSILVHGMKFEMNQDCDLATADGNFQQYFDTIIQAASGSTSGSSNWQIGAGASGDADLRTAFYGCTLSTLNHTGGNRNIAIAGGRHDFVNCTISIHTSASGCFIREYGKPNEARLIGCAITGPTTLFQQSGGRATGLIHFLKCSLPSGYTIPAEMDLGGYLLIEESGAGTISNPPLCKQSRFLGKCESDDSVYRTGGAQDGASQTYSYKVTASANCLEAIVGVGTPPMARWVSTGSQTVTIYLAGAASLNDDDVWAELYSPDEGGSPTAQGTVQTTRMAQLGTPSGLTEDAASPTNWNGSGFTTDYKISFSINPAVAGWIVAKVFVAKASAVVWVDPYLEIA